jgi:hypothetical protein
MTNFQNMEYHLRSITRRAAKVQKQVVIVANSLGTIEGAKRYDKILDVYEAYKSMKLALKAGIKEKKARAWGACQSQWEAYKAYEAACREACDAYNSLLEELQPTKTEKEN